MAGLEAVASQPTRALPSLPSAVPGCSWHGKWPLSHRSSWFLLFPSGINRPPTLRFIPVTARAPASCCAVCLCQSPGTTVETAFFFSRNGRCLLFDKVNLSLARQTYREENNPRLGCASGVKEGSFHSVVPVCSGQFSVHTSGGKGRYHRGKQCRARKQHKQDQHPPRLGIFLLPAPSPHFQALCSCLTSVRS